MEALNITALIGPPPPGTDLSDDRSNKDNAVVISICIVAALVVVARFWLKLKSERPTPRADDWLCAISLIPLVALLAAALLGSHYGLGRHVWCATIPAMVKMKKILFAWLTIYLFELLIIKFSILMFYRRIFGMNWLNWLCMILSVCWFFGSLIALLCAPDPVSFFWTETVNPFGGHYRYNFYYYYIGNAAGNVATDLMILIVPIPVVWRLQMRVLQKVMVSTVLLLGLFVCVASIIRLHFLTFMDGAVDITWTLSNVYVWSTVEPCVGIICACLPVLQPIIRSAMKMEHFIYIRRRMTGVRKPSVRRTSSQNVTLQKRSSHSSHRMTPVDSLDGKPEGMRRHNDEIGLVSVAARSESVHARQERKSLEDYLGPMFIRVQHEVEWSVEQS